MEGIKIDRGGQSLGLGTKTSLFQAAWCVYKLLRKGIPPSHTSPLGPAASEGWRKAGVLLEVYNVVSKGCSTDFTLT